MTASVACAGPGAREKTDPSTTSRTEGTAKTISYDVNIDGVADNELKAQLKSVSNAELGSNKPPTSFLILRGRAQNDIPLLEKAMRGLGYFEGTATFVVQAHDKAKNPAEALVETDATIIFDIKAGARYSFNQLEIELNAPAAIDLPSLRDLGFAADEPAISAVVVETERAILERIRAQGYPFAKILERDAIVDFDTRRMNVTLRFDAGAKTPFGEIKLTGIDGIDRDFLLKRLNFKQGDRYEPVRLRDARQRLIATGLFATVRVLEGARPDRYGRLPVTFELAKRKSKSIGGGVSYRTDEGPGIRLFWEHRNAFGRAERVRAETEANQIREEASLRLRKPDFWAVDQALLANATGKRENTDAFQSKSFETGIGVERIFNKHVTGTLGAAYRFADIEDNDGQQLFGLASVPASLFFNYSDDFLDPSNGWRLLLDGAPNFDMLGVGRNFYRIRGTMTRYFRIFNEPRTVLAFRASAGSIFGATRSAIPADERFFSGGGGSVRGIGFQLAGPVDDDNDPIGGASLIEFGSEFRIKAYGDLEFVAFFDGGAVYSPALPDGSEDLRFGTGIGLRYISPIGPLRFDLGFPLERRRRVDDPFQFYLSIGQAF